MLQQSVCAPPAQRTCELVRRIRVYVVAVVAPVQQQERDFGDGEAVDEGRRGVLAQEPLPERHAIGELHGADDEEPEDGVGELQQRVERAGR